MVYDPGIRDLKLERKILSIDIFAGWIEVLDFEILIESSLVF